MSQSFIHKLLINSFYKDSPKFGKFQPNFHPQMAKQVMGWKKGVKKERIMTLETPKWWTDLAPIDPS